MLPLVIIYGFTGYTGNVLVPTETEPFLLTTKTKGRCVGRLDDGAGLRRPRTAAPLRSAAFRAVTKQVNTRTALSLRAINESSNV